MRLLFRSMLVPGTAPATRTATRRAPSQSKNRMLRKMSETGNRVVLITGGSRGIGFGTARVMGRGGWKVGISGTSEKALAAASARLAEDGIEHYAVAFRVEDAGAWSGAVDAVEQAIGPVSGLVCSAGI